MTLRSLFLDRRFYAILAIVALAVSAIAGSTAIAGMAMGLGSATFNLVALWYLIGLLGGSVAKGWSGKAGAPLVVVAFFLKLPVYVGLGLVAQRIGNAAPACFLLGVGLVYSALVGWALAKS